MEPGGPCVRYPPSETARESAFSADHNNTCDVDTRKTNPREENTREDIIEYEVIVPERGDAWYPHVQPKKPSASQSTDFQTAVKIHNDKDQWCMLRQSIKYAIEMCYALVSNRDCNTASEDAVLSMMNSSGTIRWEKASVAHYSTGISGEKPIIMSYTSNVGNSTLTNPMVLVAFPGMDFTAPNDVLNALYGVKHTTIPGTNIRGHHGFVQSALSVEEKLLSFLNSTGVPIEDIQVVFCGHSMGGAVASLCGAAHAHRMRHTRNKNAVVFTFGQPKTFSQDGAAEVENLLGKNNYIRFVTFGSYPYGTPSKTDSFTGYRNSTVDSFSFEHAGWEIRLNSEKTLTLALGLERISLHYTHVYWDALLREDRERFRQREDFHHPGSFVTYLPMSSFSPLNAHWNCCGMALPHSIGCMGGMPSQHRAPWDEVNLRWPCCQADGQWGKRSVPGCSVEFAESLIEVKRTELEAAEAALAEAQNQLKKASQSLGAAQSNKALHKRISGLFTQFYAAEAVVKDKNAAVGILRGKLAHAEKNSPT